MGEGHARISIARTRRAKCFVSWSMATTRIRETAEIFASAVEMWKFLQSIRDVQADYFGIQTVARKAVAIGRMTPKPVTAKSCSKMSQTTNQAKVQKTINSRWRELFSVSGRSGPLMPGNSR